MCGRFYRDYPTAWIEAELSKARDRLCAINLQVDLMVDHFDAEELRIRSSLPEKLVDRVAHIDHRPLVEAAFETVLNEAQQYVDALEDELDERSMPVDSIAA